MFNRVLNTPPVSTHVALFCNLPENISQTAISKTKILDCGYFKKTNQKTNPGGMDKYM